MAKDKVASNTYIYAIGEIVPRLMSLFLLPIFTLYLSPSDYGIISYTNSLMLFLFVFSSFALNTYLLRTYFDRDTVEDRKKLIGNVFSVIILFNCILLIAGYTIFPSIFGYAEIQFSFYPYLSISILNNFLEVFSIVPLVIFRVKQKAQYFVALNVIRSLLIFLLTYILIVHMDWGIMGNYYGRLIINLCFLVVYLIIIAKQATLNLKWEQAKKALKFSMPLVPGAISYLLISMSDRIILERYVSLSEVGIYSVAFTLAFSLRIITTSAYRAFEPEIYKRYNGEGFSEFFHTGYKNYMFIVLIAASGLSFMSKDILLLMTTASFVEGYYLVPIFLIGGLITAENIMLGSLVIAEKKTHVSSFSTITGGLVSVISNIIFVPYFGIYAAAVSLGLAYVVMNIILLKGMSFKSNVILNDFFAILIFITSSYFVTQYSNYQEFALKPIAIKGLLLLVFVFIYGSIYGVSLSKIKSFARRIF